MLSYINPVRLRAMTDTDTASLEAAMQVPITVWLGPVGPLLRKLHGRSLVPNLLTADEIHLLTKLCIWLKDMSEDEEATFMVQWWMKMVRELCYDTEDHLDDVTRAHHHISGLLARARDAIQRRKTFEWSPPKTIKPADHQMEAGVHKKVGIVEPPKKLVELLALDDPRHTLKVIPISGCAGVGKTTAARALYHRHIGEFQCRAFVTVSRNPDMRGFLTSMLSQLKAPCPHGFPDVPELIDAIRNHLEGRRYLIIIDDLWTKSVWTIVSRAFPRDNYCSRIITTTQIDDVALACCSYDSDCMYMMEPLNDHESRKLFFSRVFGCEDGCPTNFEEVSHEIVRKCGGLPLAIVHMATLLASKSNIEPGKWKHIQDFLSSSSFVEDDSPTDSRGQKTNGKSPAVSESPAAKVNLGLPGHGMSSSSTKRIDALNLVYNRLQHLMYNSLPPCLRTCLLYLSMYPEGYVMKKNELVMQWVAEGFLRAMEGKGTEEIAEGYFDELVGRGMLQAVDTDYNGEVLSCTVHQMALDFIRIKSIEENFIIIVDYYQSTLALPDKVRRLSVQFGGVQSAYIPESIVTSEVRSLIYWGFFKCVPSITEYRLLHILILHIWADQEKKSFDLTGMVTLFLLKYLKIESNITVKLPEKIQGLKHLETLQVDARLSVVPSDIVRLPRMLYLSLPSEAHLPCGIRGMTSLRTLGYFDLSGNPPDNVIDLGDLTNLQDLHLTCAKPHTDILENNIICLGSILGKLMGLKCLTLAPAVLSHINTVNGTAASSMGTYFDGFCITSVPMALERLELSRHCCIFPSLPQWIGDHVNLCILKIAVGVLSRADIDVLKGLRSLTALTLYVKTAPAEMIVIDKGGFQDLTYFNFMCAAPCLSFAQGAMPKVQILNLGFNSNKWTSHTFETVGFSHLAGLTNVCVKFGVRDTGEFNIKAAQSALQAISRNHPNSLIIRVQSVDVISYVEEDLTESTKTKEQEEGERQEIQEDKAEALVQTRSARGSYMRPPQKVRHGLTLGRITKFFKRLSALTRTGRQQPIRGGESTLFLGHV